MDVKLELFQSNCYLQDFPSLSARPPTSASTRIYAVQLSTSTTSSPAIRETPGPRIYLPALPPVHLTVHLLRRSPTQSLTVEGAHQVRTTTLCESPSPEKTSDLGSVASTHLPC